MVDLTTITVDDFKNQFPRDFPYLPVWTVANQPYNTGDRVHYTVTKLFYDAVADGVTTVPTDTNDWLQVEDDIENYVQDSDIDRAFIEAQFNFNQGLFSSDEQITLSYLYLTAHYLVLDIQNASKGLDNVGKYPVSSRSVGSVSEGYEVPDIYKTDPTFSYLAQTGYGLKYLSFVIPRLIGNVGAVEGTTLP